jgi:hypothetical protein
MQYIHIDIKIVLNGWYQYLISLTYIAIPEFKKSIFPIIKECSNIGRKDSFKYSLTIMHYKSNLLQYKIVQL